ncbi:MAG: hypothetical protein M3077_08875 [Candidatus Dormibacteraeota bacterium]|nr:hypothetical protein [Candidatus Dormibacteraeota bacterium]MDQ6884328.1 hypothetical protein [Candidatus Dormibacteraeota bacterium]
MPLPLLAVLGAGVADCRLLLFVDDAELEPVVVAVDDVVFRAVLEELGDLPAYEAAAA